MKRCSKCNTVRSCEEFYKKASRSDGLSIYCKECTKVYDKAHRKTNVAIRRNARIKKLFGIDTADYFKMFEQQKGLCAICHKPETKMDWRTCKLIAMPIDHDHKTGKVRGLLCSRCNQAIGLLGDNAAVALNAAAYLEKHAANDNANN